MDGSIPRACVRDPLNCTGTFVNDKYRLIRYVACVLYKKFNTMQTRSIERERVKERERETGICYKRLAGI